MWGLVFSVFACVAPTVARGVEPLPRSVLYLDQNDPGEPIAVDMSAAFRSIINPGYDKNVTIYAESLDLIRWPGPRYEAVIKTYLREKYRDRPIGVVVAMGPSALLLTLGLRAELWPEVPAVFVASIPPGTKIPPGVTGLVRQQTLRSSANLARMLMPGLKGIALVGDVPLPQHVRAGFNDEIPALAAEVEIIDLRGLRMAELRQRIAALPDRTVIYFTTMTYEGDRAVYVSRDALVDLSQIANRPIVVDLEGHIDAGSVGGLVVDPSSIGRGAARLALRVLNGENASNIPVVTGDFVRPIFDWRQLQRWGISEKDLPPESEFRYRPPTAWEQYYWQIVLIAAAVLGQALVIASLLQERRRRHNAEIETRQRAAELAHMNRRAVAGEMSSSIAHEIKQPLTAILSNAEALQDLVGEKRPDLEKIRATVADIIEEDTRASEVIDRIRNLLRKDETKSEMINLNELVELTVRLMHGELVKRKANVETALAADLPAIVGDPVQLQQVLLNLLINAIDAVGSKTPSRRTINVSTRANGKHVEVDITDSGNGIAADDQKRIFEPFFTTKDQGLGLGLSICSTIVTAHNGKLSIQNNDHGGATAVLSLPAAPATNGMVGKPILAANSARESRTAQSHREPA